MLTHWLAYGVLARSSGETPPPVTPPVQRGDGFGPPRRERRQIIIHVIREAEEKIETIERVAKAARRRKPAPAQITAVETALDWLSEANVAPIAVEGIQGAVDALNAATGRRMAFAKALERHAEMLRAEVKRRKRNEEAALVLLLTS